MRWQRKDESTARERNIRGEVIIHTSKIKLLEKKKKKLKYIRRLKCNSIIIKKREYENL